VNRLHSIVTLCILRAQKRGQNYDANGGSSGNSPAITNKETHE
jgi:hypothetical protein